MAHLIKLKRTSVEGKVPTTSNLQLGELAINTYDGRIFFEKNDGSAAIKQILTTDSITTGSITLSATGSFGRIIGSIGSTNGVISGSSQITDLTTHKETVTGASSYTVDHNLGEQYPIVQAWNSATSKQELPNSITTNSTNRVTVDFSTTFAGIIIVKK